VDVVPADPDGESPLLGIAIATAGEIERRLRTEQPGILAIGTGRTLKAAVEQLTPMACPQHRIVSLTGNIAPDGSASFYNVVFLMADAIKARSYPMPLPVIASSPAERDALHRQPMIQTTLDLAARADVTFVGIGGLGADAPLFVDGFITEAELKALQRAGAVGEIVGWAFDAQGRILEGLTNERVASAPLPSRESSLVIGVARGLDKAPAIRAALNRRLVNGIITDEETAEALLERR
jgi:DNA-binding transcriptional regulator LsrR (DeoR family)